MNNIEVNEISFVEKVKFFFEALKQGEFGLAKTFWIFGILISNILSSIAGMIDVQAMLIFSLLILIMYELVVALAVWRAASKYEGLKLWAILAKVVVVLWLLSVIKGVAVLGLLGVAPFLS